MNDDVKETNKDIPQGGSLKKDLICLFISIPAIMGLLFTPIMIIQYQWGFTNMNNPLYSKITISFCAVCMYIFYGFLLHRKIKKLRLEKDLEDAKFTKEQKKIIDNKLNKYFKNKKCEICNHKKFYSNEVIFKLDPLKKTPGWFPPNIPLLAVVCEFCNHVNLFYIEKDVINIKNETKETKKT